MPFRKSSDLKQFSCVIASNSSVCSSVIGHILQELFCEGECTFRLMCQKLCNLQAVDCT